MKKILLTSISILLALCLITGCGSKKENNNIQEETITENKINEGLEIVNTGISNQTIKTIIINNTGATYESLKIKMIVRDSKENIILEKEIEIKEKIKTGTTKTIETKVKESLNDAASIEYNIL